jgi:hypothetical protein
VNGVLCYFSHNVVLQRKQHVKGRNIDMNKEETRARIQHFITHAFKNTYIDIWSCMLIEDVMEVLTYGYIQEKTNHKMCNHSLDFDDLLNIFSSHFTID